MILLEYMPWNLSAWLDRQLAAGPESMEAACRMVERGLTVDVPLMNALGLLHGDAHHGNLLTDGHRLYFADLGLAMSARFALSSDELSYLRDNASLDRSYGLAKWCNWLVKAWSPAASSLQERRDLVCAIACGESVQQLIPGLPASVAAIIRRHAPVANAINDFYVKLHDESRSTRYPSEDIEALLEPAPG